MLRTDSRRWALAALLLLALPAGPALAQDDPKPDQLRKMYDDALQQLKRAQDRKNELQKQLDSTRQQIADAEREAAAMDQSSYELRSMAATWRAFLNARPKVNAQWREFLRADRAWDEVPGLSDIAQTSASFLSAAPQGHGEGR